jgi:hypothetical protein
VLGTDLTPDEFADRIGQASPGYPRNDFAHDCSVTAGVSPTFSWLLLPLSKPKLDQISFSSRLGEFVGCARLQPKRCFQLILLVSGIAIGIAAVSLPSMPERISDVTQANPAPAASLQFRHERFHWFLQIDSAAFLKIAGWRQRPPSSPTS